MKKKLLGLALGAVALTTAATLTSCADKDVFHIYCWNQEFQGFFNKYISDEKTDKADVYHLDGKEVKWTQVTSDGGAYQKSLDEALANNKKAKKSEKVDMFLAEADYIVKYADSTLTKDVTSIGVSKDDMKNTYNYTVQAASDAKGVVKGVSFQCCPAGMIYRTDIAEKVLNVKTPEQMQELVSDWSKFDEVAAKMKASGYYMTGSYADTYRVFSNNAAAPWVDSDNNLTIPTVVNTWMEQADNYIKNGYTKPAGVWDADKTKEFTASGKAFCTFGPAWYYNFSMGTAQNGEAELEADGKTEKKDANGNVIYKEGTNTFGKWNVIKGPQSHFWGGTWALAAEGGDDDALVAKVMKACLSEDFSNNIIKNDGQFSNNKVANANYAKSGKGNDFLGGQNDTQIWVDMADSIQFKNNTIYDQQCNEGLQTEYVKYLKGAVKTKEEAISSFYSYIKTQFPAIKTK